MSDPSECCPHCDIPTIAHRGGLSALLTACEKRAQDSIANDALGVSEAYDWVAETLRLFGVKP